MKRSFHPLLHDRVMSALANMGFLSQRRHPPLGAVGVPIAGLDFPWGIDILSREREANPAVRVVTELLKAAAKQKASSERKAALVS